MPSVFLLPYSKRKLFCVGVSLIAGIVVAFSLPPALVEQVPMVRAAAIINSIVMGLVLTLVGFFTWHPVLRLRMHPLFRGALAAALVHLDYVIYAWTDQRTFWSTLVLAALFGAVVDTVASHYFGEGKKLMEGMTK